MIKVYKIYPGDQKSAVTEFYREDKPVPEFKWEYDRAIAAGNPLAAIWQVHRVEFMGPPKYPVGHFGYGDVGSSFMVHPAAMAIPEIVSFMRANGDLLPVETGGEPSYLFSPIGFLDCLDEERTKFDVLELRKGVRRTNYPVFRQSALRGIGFFRIREYWPPIYLAEPDGGGFKAMYERLGLTGLEFREEKVSDA